MRQFLLSSITLLAALSSVAQYNDISCLKRPYTTRIVQIDQLDNSTVVYLEYMNDGSKYMNVYDNIELRIEDTDERYHLLNSYNMPLSDRDNSRQIVFDNPDQIHRFALEFDKVPFNGRMFEIVESENNVRALNFYDITIDTTSTVEPINYDKWVRDYPVKEFGSYADNGEVTQYMAYKGIMVSAHAKKTNEYGKYFTVDLFVQNFSDHDVLVDPAAITATSFIPKSKKVKSMKVLTADEYDKKIRNRQNWTTFFVAAATVAATVAVGALESSADHKHHHRYDPPRHRGWRPVYGIYHPYYPSGYYRRHYHSDDYGGLATAATLVTGAVATAAVAESNSEKRKELDCNYLKLNTVKKGSELLGYVNIKFEKTDNLQVNIPIMGEDFQFRFQWQ